LYCCAHDSLKGLLSGRGTHYSRAGGVGGCHGGGDGMSRLDVYLGLSLNHGFKRADDEHFWILVLKSRCKME